MPIQLAAEDRFALLNLRLETELAPHFEVVHNLGAAMSFLERDWDFFWDFRRFSGHLYGDVIDAIQEIQTMNDMRVIASPSSADRVADALRMDPAAVERVRSKPILRRPLNLSIFEENDVLPDVPLDPEMWDETIWADARRLNEELDTLNIRIDDREYALTANALGITSDFQEIADFVVADMLQREWFVDDVGRKQEDYLSLDTMLREERARALHDALSEVATQSLLTQIALVPTSEHGVAVVPYTAYATHHVDAGADTVLVRPGRVSRRYSRVFQTPIRQLESLLSEPRLREREIEMLLREHPLFLRGLNYGEIYPQVVLPREGAGDLRPDIIAEPIGSDWAEIIDLKLPIDPILVGSANRPRLANALVDAASQLREYQAFFDDRRAASRVEAQYGFRCYRPRLVVIIGRDPRRFTVEQQRRVLTAEPALEFVTYDHLLRAAKTSVMF